MGKIRSRRARLADEFWRFSFNEELLELDRLRRLEIELLRNSASRSLIVVFTVGLRGLRDAMLKELRRL